jgi:Spy/CpxP family protein refolding chaperone
MRTLSKIVVTTATAIGITLAAAAYAHGPGFGYGQGAGMMGPQGGGPGYGMQGMHGGEPGYGMHGMYGGGPGYGMHGGAGPCLGEETIDARLDAIKNELNLTADQTKAWKAFENAIRTQVQAVTEAHPGQWSQDADEHIAFMEKRLEGMKAVQKARTDVYNVLTPEQKAVLDRYWLRGPRA